MELSKEDKENIKFALKLAIETFKKAPTKQLRLMKINKVLAIEQFETILRKID